MITFNGTNYLMRQWPGFNPTRRDVDDVGRVDYANQSCTVLSVPAGRERFLALKVQHLNKQYPTYYMLRTQAQLLEGWA